MLPVYPASQTPSTALIPFFAIDDLDSIFANVPAGISKTMLVSTAVVVWASRINGFSPK